ncbi:hypothetical protein [Enterovibrio coralii]|uniref:Uncharacterized protein n=1 Tax=Enterovibrio coralii TaxID=294935 RepID=A0A135ICF5_9GAMM|nr:hypothetical protein [Enterovibrio coralii]KXF83024.1 hypothetical protein ATN88_04620 [Enterovibrio coralii]
MKVNIHFEQIQIADNANYREVYRAVSDAVRQNWPTMQNMSLERQQVAQQRASSQAARQLMKTLSTGRAR